MGQRITKAQVAPPLPVRKVEDIKGPFDIFKLDTFKGRFGVSWRVNAVDYRDGDRFLFLLQSNAVRDDELGAIQSALEAGALANPGDPPVAGPFTIEPVKLPNGHNSWNLIDFDDEDILAPDPEPATTRKGR